MILTTSSLLLAAGRAAPAAVASPRPLRRPPRHTVLVLPPEAAAGSAEPWIGEAVADQLPRSLAQLGVAAVSRAERLRAQDALEIPRRAPQPRHVRARGRGAGGDARS